MVFRAADHNETIYFTEFASRIGTIQLRGTETVLTGVFMAEHRHEPARPADAVRDAAPLRAARQQLEEYLAGERREFSLVIGVRGTTFQIRVWLALREIPYGETISYLKLAERVESPRAFRAVGQANGRNPLSIVVPCHRVIAADGSLGGYGGGLERKRILLALEKETTKAG